MKLKFRQFYNSKEEGERLPAAEVSSEREVTEVLTKIEKKERSFAIFSVGEEWYGVELDRILEILHDFEIIPVPHLPPVYCGVTNLRGESVPVVVMSKLLNQISKGENKSCIITVVHKNKIGLLVDSEVEIYNIEKGKLYPLPDCYTKEESEFLEGIFWQGERFIGILRVERALSLLSEWRSNEAR